ncbi:hypothetical protein I79_026025 [Cricetulus griseus]|uniref:Uncharacterized protein n=1 Tax=Cricetulus griseus TaxID=10029 RepID=G3IPU7_CRIGR|nr:hypothetical protein I79_026025 [Cricetulus griseus]
MTISKDSVLPFTSEPDAKSGSPNDLKDIKHCEDASAQQKSSISLSTKRTSGNMMAEKSIIKQ